MTVTVTVLAAVKAKHRHIRAVRRANGPNSYVTYRIVAGNDADIRDEVSAAEVEFIRTESR